MGALDRQFGYGDGERRWESGKLVMGRERWGPCGRACKAGCGLCPASGHLTAHPPGCSVPGTQKCRGWQRLWAQEDKAGMGWK